MVFPQSVEITEVGPRDGIQNVHDLVSFDGKVAIIRKMAEAGFKRIEAVSFVSPKAIPQMADAKEVFMAVKDDLRKNGVRSVALVPNARGVETAVECGVDEVTYVISVSEQHNMANVRRTPAESMEQFRQLIEQYKDQINFRLGLVTALGSPFAGEEIRTETVVEMARFGLELGQVEDVVIGSVAPQVMHTLSRAVQKYVGKTPLVLDEALDPGLPYVECDSDERLGPDRAAADIAAIAKYGAPLVVLDFGTATTVDAVGEDGVYQGGCISAGLRVTMDALTGAGVTVTQNETGAAFQITGPMAFRCSMARARHTALPPGAMTYWSQCREHMARSSASKK